MCIRDRYNTLPKSSQREPEPSTSVWQSLPSQSVEYENRGPQFISQTETDVSGTPRKPENLRQIERSPNQKENHPLETETETEMANKLSRPLKINEKPKTGDLQRDESSETILSEASQIESCLLYTSRCV